MRGDRNWQRESKTRACDEAAVHRSASGMSRWVVPSLTMLSVAFNVIAMGASLYLFRYAIQCGLGVGVYSLFFYIPSLLLILLAGTVVQTKLLARTRNVLLLLNAIYIGLLLLQGTCFSCVDACVEALRES